MMDTGGHWEETILARLEHGFSSLGNQLAELKGGVSNQQAESASLRNAIQVLSSKFEEKWPWQFYHDSTVAKEDVAVDEADVSAKATSPLPDMIVTQPDAEAAEKTVATSASTTNATVGEEAPPATKVSFLPVSDPSLSDGLALPVYHRMQSMPVGGVLIMAEEGCQKPTKWYKLRDIWEEDEATLQRLSADPSSRANLQTPRLPSGSRFSKHESAEVAAKMPSLLSYWRGYPGKKGAQARFAIHPHAVPRLIWDLMGVLLLGYDFALIPLQTFDLPNLIILQVLHWTTRLYWTLDIFASFVTGYYQEGKLEMRLRKIAYRYATRWLLLDIVIVLPEWVVVLTNSDGKTNSLGAQGLLRGVRGVRFLRLLRLAKVQRMVYLVEARVNSSYVLLCLGILRLLAGLVMVIHFFACAWYWIGSSSSDGWVHSTDIVHKDFTERYVSCFQWSLHQFHPASRKEMIEGTLSERVFVLVCALCGLAISSVFVSSITNTMLQLQSLQEERTKQLRAVREFVLEHSISLELALRAKKYVRARLEDALRRKYENELLELLPESLLTDLHEEARWPIVSHHPFLADLRRDYPRIVRRLCHEAMAEFTAHPGDVVFHAGDVCKRFFFVWRGDLRYFPNADAQESAEEQDGADEEEDEIDASAFDENASESHGKSGDSALRKDQSIMSINLRSVPVHPVSYLSEATLWTYWEHRGALKAKGSSSFLTINSVKFAPIIKDTAFAFIDAAVYAKKFVQRLNEDPEFRCDFVMPGVQNSNIITNTLAIGSWRIQHSLTSFWGNRDAPVGRGQLKDGSGSDATDTQPVVTVERKARLSQDLEKANTEDKGARSSRREGALRMAL